MKKILIATTNNSKFNQMMAELSDLHFDFVSLRDLKLHKIEVAEPHGTTWENAVEKAKFFAEKSGNVTLAEDTGLFIDFLQGEPGVKSKRYGASATERNTKVLEQLRGVPNTKRTAYFETSGCLYDPSSRSFSIFFGKSSGIISQKISREVGDEMGYDSIFYFPPLKKFFAEMELLEKNRVSSRGNMIQQVKHFLTRNFQPLQVICAAGIIVKNGKMLMTKRRDMRSEFNDKWEFPGGGVENGSSFTQTLKNEVLEETGFKVHIKEQLPEIFTENNKLHGFQVHLYMCICNIESGKIRLAPSESSDYGWFTYTEALQMDLLPLNKKFIQSKKNREVLLKYITY